jgi:hypothetical protein
MALLVNLNLLVELLTTVNDNTGAITRLVTTILGIRPIWQQTKIYNFPSFWSNRDPSGRKFPITKRMCFTRGIRKWSFFLAYLGCTKVALSEQHIVLNIIRGSVAKQLTTCSRYRDDKVHLTLRPAMEFDSTELDSRSSSPFFSSIKSCSSSVSSDVCAHTDYSPDSSFEESSPTGKTSCQVDSSLSCMTANLHVLFSFVFRLSRYCHWSTIIYVQTPCLY